jgi:hypothetical protein
MHTPGHGGFKSKAQWKWAFATHKTWAHKAAHKSRAYKTLPHRKGVRKR